MSTIYKILCYNAIMNWKDWNPGLDNDHLTMREVLGSLPGNDPEEISKIVKFFENPDSPFAFKGAVSLERHDCIHILLGRGLLSQDEAFVIGFTMGTSKALSKTELAVFKLLVRYIYPHPYKMTANDLKIYELAVQRGHECRVEKIYDFPFENYYDETLGDLRKKIGINKDKLSEVYVKEKELLPNTIPSKRLDV